MQFEHFGKSKSVRKWICFFLSETHFGKVKAENFKRRSGFDHLILHVCDGQSGEIFLIIMWRKEMPIRELGATENYIDVIINDGVKWT